MPQPVEEFPNRVHFPFLANLEIPPEWEAATGRWLEAGGAVMVLGAPDTGKSTLCRYLLYRAYAAGQRAALIDLDVGQSHLGPSTTLGLGFFPPRRPGDGSLFPEGLYFIGQTSPVGAILEVAVGCRVLGDQARAAGINRVVVNTSGFVQGPGALKLKRSQVELLDPTLIFALQRADELEPLLRGLGAADRGEGGEATSPQPGTANSPHLPGAGSPHIIRSGSGPSDTPSPPGGEGWGEGEKSTHLDSIPDHFTPTPALPPQGGGRNAVAGEEGGKAFSQREESQAGSGLLGFDNAVSGQSQPHQSGLDPSRSIPPFPGWPIVRLPVSSRVRRRTPEERRAYREGRFRRYFRQARRLTLPWRPLVWEGLPLGRGRPLAPEELARLGRTLKLEVLYGESQGSRALLLLAEPAPGPLDDALGKPAPWEMVHWLSWSALAFRLVGLLDGRRRTLALGLILPAPFNPEVLSLWTPLAPQAASQVRFLKWGKIKVNLEGREL